eukprot:GHVQ01024828.1.p1 GENE.GHVQ01024828.1~~GHVQ01024828.1.p1  ORF type:complete len:308 (-),score=23.37 GHVQ01024828.1:292-1215(-)
MSPLSHSQVILRSPTTVVLYESETISHILHRPQVQIILRMMSRLSMALTILLIVFVPVGIAFCVDDNPRDMSHEHSLREDVIEPSVSAHSDNAILKFNRILQDTDNDDERDFQSFPSHVQLSRPQQFDMEYAEFSDKSLHCQFDRYFLVNRSKCEITFYRLNEFVERCGETAARRPVGLPPICVCLSFSFTFRHHQSRCANNVFAQLNPHSCQILREVTVRTDKACRQSASYDVENAVFCNNHQHYAVQYEALECLDQHSTSRHLEYCSNIRSTLLRQSDKCDSAVYYSHQSQACDDHTSFMRRYSF